MKDSDWKLTREYFETGCLCVQNGLLFVDSDVPDKAASEYYLKFFTCSRHPDYKEI